MRLLAATLAGLILLLAGAVGWWTAQPPAAPITVIRTGRAPAQVWPNRTSAEPSGSFNHPVSMDTGRSSSLRRPSGRMPGPSYVR